MNWGTPDNIDRTAKILVDSGRAATYPQARDDLHALGLQIAVGTEIAHDPAAQAALATAVNVGGRAFRAGVRVCLDADPVLATGWTAAARASQVITRYGGAVVDRLDTGRPTLTIGRPTRAEGSPVVHLTWRGWSGGVVAAPVEVLPGPANPPAGVLAAALGVAELFQHCLGDVTAARRALGISLWRPDLDWRAAPPGPTLRYLPKALWLLGLGHLGQAYAWTLGMLPYATPDQVRIGLMDFDVAVPGNTATQLLMGHSDAERLKTRVVATALERRGFTTRLVERAFDSDFHAAVHADPRRNEPAVALAGFDAAAPRRALGDAGFGYVVDAGLGSGPTEYLDILLHTFPARVGPTDAFRDDVRPVRPLGAAYEAEVAREVAAGRDVAAARCGMLDIAGVTVGAAFVGTVAATLVVADILRQLHQGRAYSVIGCDLRDGDMRTAANAAPGQHCPIPYTLV
jgi:hypothetical protein